MGLTPSLSDGASHGNLTPRVSRGLADGQGGGEAYCAGNGTIEAASASSDPAYCSSSPAPCKASRQPHHGASCVRPAVAKAGLNGGIHQDVKGTVPYPPPSPLPLSSSDLSPTAYSRAMAFWSHGTEQAAPLRGLKALVPKALSICWFGGRQKFVRPMWTLLDCEA